MIAPSPATRTDILEFITDGVMVLDGEWRVTYVNRAAERLTGLPRDEVLGKDHWKLFPAAIGTTLHSELLRAAAQRESVDFEQFYAPSRRWSHVKAYPVPEGLIVFFEDITARKESEQEHAAFLARESEAREEAEILNQVSRTLSAELDLKKLAQAATDAAAKLTGASFGAFYNASKQEGEDYPLYTLSSASREAFDQVSLPRNAPLLEPVFRGSRIVRSDDILADPNYRTAEPPHGIRPVRSYLAVPISGRSGDVLGGLVLGHPEPGIFTERAERLATGIAAHAAIAIANARLFATSEQEIEGRRMAEEWRYHSEAHFREMIEALPAAIYTTDAEGLITHFNSAAVNLSGRVPELGKDRWCVTLKLFRSNGEPLEHDQSPMAEAVSGGGVSRGGEYIAERPDGSRFWFTPYPTPLRDVEGRIIGGINMLVDITDRKAAERTSLLLSAIVDSSDDAIISKNLNGIITSWNKGAERLFGYTAGEVVGKPITILIPPDRLQEEPNILDRLKRGERVDHFETIRVRKDGSKLNISLTISPVKDSWGIIIGASKIARDITDRKRTEAALRESENRFRQLADSMPQMVWTARPDGYLDYYNERWYAFTGFSNETFGDAGWLSILHPDDLKRCSQEWDACVASGKPFTIEYRFWDRHERRWRWFMGRALPVRGERGSIVKWFGTCTDIDAQKSVEDEMRRANHDLEQFAYSASHDLQEPLRTLKIYSELLTSRYRDKLDGDALQFCDYLRAGATRMQMLVHDLLTYTQVSRFDTPLETVDANAALNETLANLAGAITESGAVISSERLPCVPIRGGHLKQLFQNFIGNAIKYRSPDRSPVIHVKAKQQGETWTFSVRDNGIGIDPEYKEQVFGLFKRLHTADEYSGTGIGLAICQRIVERYRGRIWVESEPGQGSTFLFTVPC